MGKVPPYVDAIDVPRDGPPLVALIPVHGLGHGDEVLSRVVVLWLSSGDSELQHPLLEGHLQRLGRLVGVELLQLALEVEGSGAGRGGRGAPVFDWVSVDGGVRISRACVCELFFKIRRGRLIDVIRGQALSVHVYVYKRHTLNS